LSVSAMCSGLGVELADACATRPISAWDGDAGPRGVAPAAAGTVCACAGGTAPNRPMEPTLMPRGIEWRCGRWPRALAIGVLDPLTAGDAPRDNTNPAKGDLEPVAVPVSTARSAGFGDGCICCSNTGNTRVGCRVVAERWCPGVAGGRARAAAAGLLGGPGVEEEAPRSGAGLAFASRFGR